MTRLSVVLALALATALTSPPRAQPESENDLLWRAASRAQEKGICNIHHIRMQEQLVPVCWHKDLPSEDYISVMLHEFPNGQRYEDGGSELMVPRLAHVKRSRYVCAECNRAAKKWASAHRSDQQAQCILSHQ